MGEENENGDDRWDYWLKRWDCTELRCWDTESEVRIEWNRIK